MLYPVELREHENGAYPQFIGRKCLHAARPLIAIGGRNVCICSAPESVALSRELLGEHRPGMLQGSDCKSELLCAEGRSSRRAFGLLQPVPQFSECRQFLRRHLKVAGNVCLLNRPIAGQEMNALSVNNVKHIGHEHFTIIDCHWPNLQWLRLQKGPGGAGEAAPFARQG